MFVKQLAATSTIAFSAALVMVLAISGCDGSENLPAVNYESAPLFLSTPLSK